MVNVAAACCERSVHGQWHGQDCPAASILSYMRLLIQTHYLKKNACKKRCNTADKSVRTSSHPLTASRSLSASILIDDVTRFRLQLASAGSDSAAKTLAQPWPDTGKITQELLPSAATHSSEILSWNPEALHDSPSRGTCPFSNWDAQREVERARHVNTLSLSISDRDCGKCQDSSAAL